MKRNELKITTDLFDVLANCAISLNRANNNPYDGFPPFNLFAVTDHERKELDRNASELKRLLFAPVEALMVKLIEGVELILEYLGVGR